jgi:hypothetical protein
LSKYTIQWMFFISSINFFNLLMLWGLSNFFSPKIPVDNRNQINSHTKKKKIYLLGEKKNNKKTNLIDKIGRWMGIIISNKSWKWISGDKCNSIKKFFRLTLTLTTDLFRSEGIYHQCRKKVKELSTVIYLIAF